MSTDYNEAITKALNTIEQVKAYAHEQITTSEAILYLARVPRETLADLWNCEVHEVDQIRTLAVKETGRKLTEQWDAIAGTSAASTPESK